MSTIKENIVSCLTLVKMQAHRNYHPSPTNHYKPGRASLAAMYAAGVTILAGSDANKSSNNAKVEYREGLHKELELLVEARLSKSEALRAVTVLPTEVFGLTDRGSVRPGLRADLVLIRIIRLRVLGLCSW